MWCRNENWNKNVLIFLQVCSLYLLLWENKVVLLQKRWDVSCITILCNMTIIPPNRSHKWCLKRIKCFGVCFLTLIPMVISIERHFASHIWYVVMHVFVYTLIILMLLYMYLSTYLDHLQQILLSLWCKVNVIIHTDIISLVIVYFIHHTLT
jgi:hypothetical protein